MNSRTALIIASTGVLLLCFAFGCRTAADSHGSNASQPPDSSSEAPVAGLGTDLTRWGAFGFSGAVLVARGERILLSAGFGLANRNEATAVTPRTLFDIGSLSKQFTAAAILALAEEGRLDIRGVLPSVLSGVPPDKSAITVHHLLTHTSGISDFGSENELLSRDELVRQILAAPLSQAPGSSYEYSNLGYTLLAAIIEHASGRHFDDYLAQRLFARAGLRHTTFTWALSAGGTDSIALGYGGYRHPAEGEDPRDRVKSWRRRGSGNVLSTTEDLLTWFRALKAGHVLGAKSLEAMFTSHTTAEADFLTYGYGWRMQTTVDGERLVWHSGLDEAYSTMFRHYSDQDIVLVFLSNCSIGGVPMREILAFPSRSGPPSSKLFAEVVSSPPEYTSDISQLSAYRGRYRVGATGAWEADVDGGALVLRAEGQEAIDALFPPLDTAVVTAYREHSARALELARSLAARGRTGKQLLDAIDRLGYAQRGASRVAADWTRYRSSLGPLVEIRILGTTGLRGRRDDQFLTYLRLVFANGSVNEHVIWFADDEVYVVPGNPLTLAVRFRQAPDDGLVGFDLLSQRHYDATLQDGDSILVLNSGGVVTQAVRER